MRGTINYEIMNILRIIHSRVCVREREKERERIKIMVI